METRIKVKGMACGGCSANLERAMNEVKGVDDVKASHKDGVVVVVHDGTVDVDILRKAIKDAGYETV